MNKLKYLIPLGVLALFGVSTYFTMVNEPKEIKTIEALNAYLNTPFVVKYNPAEMYVHWDLPTINNDSISQRPYEFSGTTRNFKSIGKIGSDETVSSGAAREVSSTK